MIFKRGNTGSSGGAEACGVCAISEGTAGAGSGALVIGTTAVAEPGCGALFAGAGCFPSPRRFMFCQTTNAMSAMTSVPASTISGSHEPEDFGSGAALKVSSGSAFVFGCPAARFVRYW